MAVDALVGSTGFVGGWLRNSFHFSELYNSKNIEEIQGRSFNRLFCAGAPAAKWQANREPEIDKKNIYRLLSCLRRVKLKKLILISSIDVFKNPVECFEDDIPLEEGLHPYGAHRRLLEKELVLNFDTLILRLPGLFGDGLRKNAIFDLLNENNVQQIDSRGVFQFYNMKWLSGDISKALDLNIPILHTSSEPISIGEFSEFCIGKPFVNILDGEPVRYDFRSKFFRQWGGKDGYLYSRHQVFHALRQFAENYRRR